MKKLFCLLLVLALGGTTFLVSCGSAKPTTGLIYGEMFNFSSYKQSYAVIGVESQEEDIVIPSEVGDLYVTHIAGGAFARHGSVAPKIKTVVIGDRVVSIGVGAFEGCGSLTSVTMGSNITHIGDHAFSGCTELATVTIGKKLTHIGEGAFKGDTALTTITIPSTVKSIGANAFSGCTSLVTIVFQGTQARWEAIEKAENWAPTPLNENGEPIAYEVTFKI